MTEKTVPVKRGGRKPGQKNLMSANKVNSELRTMYMTSLHFLGGVKYLNWLAKKHPAVFMMGLSKYMRHDANEPEAGVTYVIQQLNVVATPVPGVLNSPIEGHIQQLKLVANGGEVIDMEPQDGHAAPD
jgi:hypothetical protein